MITDRVKHGGIGICLAAALVFGSNGADAQSQAGIPASEQVVLLSALVRQAREAQRDCNIVAKRDSVNALQIAMQDIARTLRRQADTIARDLERARIDKLVDMDVTRAKTAIDAAVAIEDRIKSVRNRDARNRLAALRERYLDFDRWESLYMSLIRVMSRLEGSTGDCTSAAVATPLATACSPEAFEPCRHGRPTGEVDRDLVIAVPVHRR